jgi:crotonobetainyl-CoA:carnitine CoA-transferase CaiB-like acyl-CoA transferase
MFLGRPADDWLADFREAGLPCGPINSIPEVFEHPQVIPRGVVIESEHQSAGQIKLTGFPYRLSGTPPVVHRPPPRLGEHTREVLIDLLGFEESEADAFLQTDAV